MNIRLLHIITIIISVFSFRDSYAQNCFFSPCADVDCGSLNVKFAPVGGPQFCEGELITMSNTSDPGFDFFVVDWNDGIVDTSYNYSDFTHVYAFADSLLCVAPPVQFFKICFKGVKNCPQGISCQSGSYDFGIKKRPRARFNSAQEVCKGSNVQFTSISCNALTYEWDFGDGGMSTIANPVHVYSGTGTYIVKLKVTNTCGMDMITHVINVVDFPDANYVNFLDPINGCGPTIDSFINLSNVWSNTIWKILPADTSKWMFTDTLMTLTSDNITVLFKKTGIYFITLRAFNACGEDFKRDTLEIFEPPVVTMIPPAPSCDEIIISSTDLNFDYEGEITSFQWVFTNGTPSTASGPSFSGVSFQSPGSITLYITSPCGNDTFVLPVTVAITTPISFAGIPLTLCDNQDTLTLLPIPANGIWTGSGAAIGAITTGGLLTPALLAPGVYTFTYSLGSVDCPNSASVDIEILPGVNIDIQMVDTVCEQLNYTPIVNYEGGINVYTWNFAGANPSSFNGANPANILYSSPGTYLAIGTVSGLCGISIDTVEIVIQSLTPLAIATIPFLICSSSAPFYLSASPPGGTWSGLGIIDSLSGLFDPSTVPTGIPLLISYEFQSGACTNSTSVTFEVLLSQSVAIADTILCADSPPTIINASQSGGIWSGIGITDTIQGIFDPATSGQGIFDITYSWTDPAGCPVVASESIEVEDIPVITISDTTLLCITSQNIDLNLALGYQVTPLGGNTIWNGPGIINSDGTFNSINTPLIPGNYLIYLTYSRNACVVNDSAWINLIAQPILVISADTLICIDEGLLTLNSSLTGGIWSGIGIDPNTGAIDLNAAQGGIYSYIYSYQPGTSCEQVDSATIEIIDPGSTLVAGPNLEVCEGSPNIVLSGFSPLGGTWSGSAITDTITGAIDLGQLQLDTFYTYTYCVQSPLTIGCSACKTRTLRVNSLPIISYQITGLPCVGQLFTIDNQSINAAGHSWTFGDNSSSTVEDPTHIYNLPDTYTLIYIASSALGCKDTFTQQLFVTTPPLADFTLDLTEGCAPFSIGLTNNSSGYNITQAWYILNDTIYGSSPGNFIIDQISTDTVINIQLAVTNICGTVLDIDQILVHPYPIVDFGFNVDEGCSPLLIDFANTTIGNPSTFYWDLGNGNYSSDTLPDDQIYTTTDSTITEYQVTLISTNVCGADTLTRIITVFPPDVNAFIELDTLQGCQPFIFKPKSYSTPGAAISWEILNENLVQVLASNDEAPEFVVQDSGLFTIVLHASRCGSDTDTAYFRVLPSPKVAFTHLPFICAGTEISFTDQSINTTGYLWDFGDGNQSTEVSPNHLYALPGNYTIQLTGYSLLNNCPATFQSKLLVVAPPTAVFAPNITQGCGPLVIDFENQSPLQDSSSYVWDFGDGSSGAFTPNVSHTFSTPGNYTVSLMAYDKYGCFSDTVETNITVFPDPKAIFDVPPGIFCLGYDTLQLNSKSVDAVSQNWNINGNLFDTKAVSFVPTMAGNLQISLIVTNIFQCKDTLLNNINILPSAISSGSPDIVEGCEDLLVHFTNTSTNSQFYTWKFGDQNNSIDFQPSHIFTTSGQFTSQLIAQSNNGCPADTAEWTINVFPKPIAAFSIDKAKTCGVPVDVQMTNQTSQSLDFDWSFGDGGTSDVSDPIHTYLETGNHLIQLIAANEFQCRDTIEKWIDIYGQPIAKVEIPITKGCAPLQFPLINKSEQALRYHWLIEPGGEFSDQNPIITFDQAGKYNVQLIAIYNQFCADTIDITEAFEVFQNPTANFVYSVDEKENILGDVSFTNQSILADHYLWDLGDGNSATTTDVYHEYDINRSIIVNLYAYNDNMGRFTCIDTAQQIIDPEWITTFYAPNAMTPGYGQEGTRIFKPVGIGIEEYEIVIYSPWGEMVWRSTELAEHRPSGAWDGSYKGQTVPQGAYAWLAKMRFVDGSTRVAKGTVTVLR